MAKDYPPIGEAEGKKQQVEAMFDAIAPRYDLLNRMLSFGIDQRWRKRVIAMLADDGPKRVLDVATGTGDLALQALQLDPEKVVGVDISEEMLRIGREKVTEMGEDDRVQLRRGDSERLPFSDKQFDGATVAFGVRNFENLRRGLSEIHRVLKPGSPLLVLEFSHPRSFPIKQVYGLYSRYLLPKIGSLISGNEGAYKYLPASVAAFPDGEDFLNEMGAVGFRDLSFTPLTFGVASIYRGRVAS